MLEDLRGKEQTLRLTRVHDDEENYELTNFRECVRFTISF